MRNVHCLAFLLLSVVFLKGPPGVEAQPVPTPSGDQGETFVYKQTDEADLKIWMHYPEEWSPQREFPAIVFFFGGGWRSGSVEQFTPQARYLAKRGMVTARADYRVKNRHEVTPDQCVEDAKSAVRWLRNHAERLGIDPDRIVASGGSAGGHIAACTRTVDGLEPEGEDLSISSKPNLLVLYNPVLDCTDERHVARVGSKAMARKISPNLHLTDETPPTLLLYGTEDGLLAQAKTYLKRANKLEFDAELYTAERVGHAFFNRAPWMEGTLFRVDQFLARHGYLDGKPMVNVPSDGRLERYTSGSGSPSIR